MTTIGSDPQMATDAAARGSPPSAGRRTLHLAHEAALWLGALAGAACLAASIAAVAFGATLLVFTSGSMSPGIPTGSLGLALSTPADELVAGDVVSIVRADGERVTHRIAGIDHSGDRSTIITKGDANEIADPVPVTATTADRVVWSVPRMGYIFDELARPQWVFAGGLAAGVLITVSLTRAVRPTARRRTPIVALVAILALAAGVVGSPAPRDTLAAFIDGGSARQAVTTGTLLPPTILTCTLVNVGGSNAVRVTWAAPASGPAPTAYSVSYVLSGLLGSSSGTQPDTTATTADIPFGPLLAGSVRVSVTSKRGLWTSPTAATRTATVAVLTLAFSCA